MLTGSHPSHRICPATPHRHPIARAPPHRTAFSREAWAAGGVFGEVAGELEKRLMSCLPEEMRRQRTLFRFVWGAEVGIRSRVVKIQIGKSDPTALDFC